MPLSLAARTFHVIGRAQPSGTRSKMASQKKDPNERLPARLHRFNLTVAADGACARGFPMSDEKRFPESVMVLRKEFEPNAELIRQSLRERYSATPAPTAP